MDDTISRVSAIDAVRKNTFRLTFAEEQNCEGRVAWSADAVYSDVIEGALRELPSAQPNLQPTCNQLATDCISRQEALNIRFSDAINEDGVLYVPLRDFTDGLKALPSAQPETCEGCKHLDKWENEVEYGYPSPCTCCKRRVLDHYER